MAEECLADLQAAMFGGDIQILKLNEYERT